MKPAFLTLLMSLVASTLPLPMRAQETPTCAAPFVTPTMGGIRGRIVDDRGRAIANFLMTAVAEDGRKWQVHTNGFGAFRLGLLPVGTYRLLGRSDRNHMDRVDGLVVHAGAWLVATNDPWAGCGVGREIVVYLADHVRWYDFTQGSTTAFSREELDRLPVR